MRLITYIPRLAMQVNRLAEHVASRSGSRCVFRGACVSIRRGMIAMDAGEVCDAVSPQESACHGRQSQPRSMPRCALQEQRRAACAHVSSYVHGSDSRLMPAGRSFVRRIDGNDPSAPACAMWPPHTAASRPPVDAIYAPLDNAAQGSQKLVSARVQTWKWRRMRVVGHVPCIIHVHTVDRHTPAFCAGELGPALRLAELPSSSTPSPADRAYIRHAKSTLYYRVASVFGMLERKPRQNHCI